jgi:surface antigen
MKALRIMSIALLSVALCAPAAADPPDHAPAHGYRKKEARRYRGYTGKEWQEDYGIQGGRCNTDTVLAAIGAAGGAVIANRTADRDNRVIATIMGAIVGGVIGNEIGEKIDEGDRACMGHALEVGAMGRNITWTNSRTHVEHTLRPVKDLQGGCRLFEYRAGAKGKLSRMTACRDASAAWVIRKS